MKLKDYNGNLGGLKVKTTDGAVGYWESQWNKGVWLSNGTTSRMYPQFIDSLKDCLEWEITEEEVNCDQDKNL